MTEATKTRKSFKEYYADPIFRDKHKEYIKTKIPCPICNKLIARYNMSNHKKSKICKIINQTSKNNDIERFKEAFEMAIQIMSEKNTT